MRKKPRRAGRSLHSSLSRAKKAESESNLSPFKWPLSCQIFSREGQELPELRRAAKRCKRSTVHANARAVSLIRLLDPFMNVSRHQKPRRRPSKAAPTSQPLTPWWADVQQLALALGRSTAPPSGHDEVRHPRSVGGGRLKAQTFKFRDGDLDPPDPRSREPGAPGATPELCTVKLSIQA